MQPTIAPNAKLRTLRRLILKICLWGSVRRRTSRDNHSTVHSATSCAIIMERLGLLRSYFRRICKRKAGLLPVRGRARKGAETPMSLASLTHGGAESIGSRQQPDDEEDEYSSCPPTASSASAPPCAASSPSRDGRTQFSLDHHHTQLKCPSASEATGGESPCKRLHVEVQKLKEALQVMRGEKDSEIAFLKLQLSQRQSPRHSGDRKEDDDHTSNNAPRLVPWMHSITDRGDIQTARLDRHASLKTVKALAQQGETSPPSSTLAERIAAAFLNPVLSLPYLHSIQFGADLVELSAQVCALLETESRCISLASPVYVFGDLHGNLADLSFFSSHLWRLGFGLTAGSFLFLGDYVDRGQSSLECVAYLFAQKLLHPRKVFLLRGNHETRAVNGLEAYYGSGCFLTQCRRRFGHEEGYIVWHQINHAFDRLPLAATIDDAVFCVHGGIPRSLPNAAETRLESIRRLPVTAPMDVLDKRFYDTNPQLSMVSDMLWGDPAKEEHEAALDPVTGFGKSVVRGGSAVCFGSKAIADFLECHRFTHILRAHEANLDGVGVSKGAKVLTIFSTSKDHALGDEATCGCVLVDRDRIAAINRSAGQLQSLRRRRSVTSLQPPSVSHTTGGSCQNHVSGGPARSEEAGPSLHASPVSLESSASGQSRRRSSTRRAIGTLAEQTSVTRCRRSRRDLDESDSTDDEAPSPPWRPTPSGSGSPAAAATPPREYHSRNVEVADDNNQSEDDG